MNYQVSKLFILFCKLGSYCHSKYTCCFIHYLFVCKSLRTALSSLVHHVEYKLVKVIYIFVKISQTSLPIFFCPNEYLRSWRWEFYIYIGTFSSWWFCINITICLWEELYLMLVLVNFDGIFWKGMQPSPMCHIRHNLCEMTVQWSLHNEKYNLLYN